MPARQGNDGRAAGRFSKIVLTTDLSKNAEEAVPYAVELSRAYGAALVILYVFDDEEYFDAAPPEWLQARYESRVEKLKALSDRIASSSGVHATFALRKGNAAREILDYVKKERADLVVIATHGRTGLSHLLLGSVAERVVRLCNCPVLTVRSALQE